MFRSFFFLIDTATTKIYTLSLHDALPISPGPSTRWSPRTAAGRGRTRRCRSPGDRKSTRLNSSHANISYAVFCLKKKKNMDRYNLYQSPTIGLHTQTNNDFHPLEQYILLG